MSENPYTTPDSNLESEYKLNRNVAWKIYFVFMILLSVLGFLSYFAIDGAGWPEVVGAILVVPATIGFFGYVFSKKILFQKFWVANFVIQLVWAFAYYFVTNTDLAAGMDQKTFIVSQVIMWGISIPYYAALFLYARKDYPLWSN